MLEGKVGRGEKMDSRLRRSGLRPALRASVGAARLGVNFRPLPPEGNRVAPKFLKSFSTESVRSSLSVCKCWLVLVRVRQILGTPVPRVNGRFSRKRSLELVELS